MTSLDPQLLAALRRMGDLSAEFSDLLEREGFRLVVPAGVLAPTLPGSRLIGPALTLRYLPVRREEASLRTEDPGGKLGNKRLVGLARAGDVMVVESPSRHFSVLGGEAAAELRAAGVIGGVMDGAVRDVEGLGAVPFPCWTAARTPISGRWRLEAAEFGTAVSIAGVHVQPGDIVVADDSGVAFVPADRFAAMAEALLGR